MQAMARYEAWIVLFKNMHNIWQGGRLISISQNGVALGKSKKLKCNGHYFAPLDVPTGHTT